MAKNIIIWKRELSSEFTLAVSDDAGLSLTVFNPAIFLCFMLNICLTVSTYQRVTTNWFKHDVIVRTKLGAGNQGKSDEESGLFKRYNDIN